MAQSELSPSQLRDSLARDGFIRIPSVLNPQQLERLREACKNSAALARDGKWPFVRTLPRQFPPWDHDISHGIWGVQHLLHPDIPNHELFAASYFAPCVVDTVIKLLECRAEDMVMELYNLLIRPDADFSLRWHRDDIPPQATPEEEEARLHEPILHAQWNLALYDDASLIVIPGSHMRARSNVERSAGPFETHLPGQVIVKMNAGDVVFYNNNILHRGVYSSEVERMTLHGSMGVVSADGNRARNVLQHGVGAWVDRCDFSNLDESTSINGIGRLANGMKDNLIAIGSGKDVGYSQCDE